MFTRNYHPLEQSRGNTSPRVKFFRQRKDMIRFKFVTSQGVLEGRAFSLKISKLFQTFQSQEIWKALQKIRMLPFQIRKKLESWSRRWHVGFRNIWTVWSI